MGGRGGEQPLSAQRRSGDGVLHGNAQEAPPVSPPAHRRAGAEHAWRARRPYVDQEAEELLAVAVPTPANFAGQDEEALWPWLEQFWVAGLLAAACGLESRAVRAVCLVGWGALSCEGAHQSGVAAQSLPMRGSKKVKNAKQAKVESTRK